MAEAWKESPQALAAVAIVGVAAVLLLGLTSSLIARHVGGFYAHIQAEEEAARREEEMEGRKMEKGNKVKQEFNSVHDANKKQLKENVKNAAEQVDKTPFLFGLLGGLGIKALNNVIN